MYLTFLQFLHLHNTLLFHKVGALQACVLAKDGYEVDLYEYREGKKRQKYIKSTKKFCI